MRKPDFTKEDSIPENAIHDQKLGVNEARGWLYNENSGTIEARQIYITKIIQGIPADSFISAGNFILGIYG